MLVSAYFDGGEGWLVVSKYLCLHQLKVAVAVAVTEAV
jgi:hypothetical protein